MLRRADTKVEQGWQCEMKILGDMLQGGRERERSSSLLKRGTLKRETIYYLNNHLVSRRDTVEPLSQSWSCHTGRLLGKITFSLYFFCCCCCLNNWELGFLLLLAKGSCYFFTLLKYWEIKRNNSKKVTWLLKSKIHFPSRNLPSETFMSYAERYIKVQSCSLKHCLY